MTDRLLHGLTSELDPDSVVTDRGTLEAHAVDGIVPGAVCRPADADQIASVLRLCREAGAAVTPWGGGTTIGLGNVPRRVDVVLRMDRLAALGEHDDANLTATIAAGMTLSALQSRLAQRGQFLAFDPPRPDQATIGGVVAASTNGPRRMFYGGVRDLVIGMKMVLPGGEQVKAGGKVVKNVAGYDMCKLFVGSLGTLGIITEVTCKMTPLPERVLTLAARGDMAGAFRLVDAVFASTLQPAALAVLDPQAAELVAPAGSRTVTVLSVEGFAEAVDRHVRDISGMARAEGLALEVLDGAAHERVWAAVRDFSLPRPGEAMARLTVPAGAVAAAAETLSRLGGVRGWIAHAGSGTIWIRADAARTPAVFADLIAFAASRRGHAVLTSAPPETKQGLDIWGPPPPALSIMKEIKQRFDPEQVLNPGRFVAFL